MGERLGISIDGPLASAQGVLGPWNGAGVGAASVPLAFCVFCIHAGENRSVIFPGRKVEESGAWAVRRRIPVCSALNARIRRGTGRLRCEDRPAIGVEAACPVNLNERAA